MGEADLHQQQNQLIVHATLFFYGNAASSALSEQIAADIANHWNESKGTVKINGNYYKVYFNIEGFYEPNLTPLMVFENTNPRNNYFRIEEFANGNISFVDGVGSNTGYFKLDNLLNNSTTGAHEFGHTIGLEHPEVLDIRGKSIPGIMYPRGTIVDRPFQYNPLAAALEPGGTMNPFTRKVSQEDIDNLKLHRLTYNSNGVAMLGDFSSVWHDAHLP
jgi:hypothetical protein